MSDITEHYVEAEETDDSCRLEFIEIVPLTRDTDGPCSALIRSQLRSHLSRKMKMTAERDSGDRSVEFRQETLPVMKQEPDDVCCIVYCLMFLHVVWVASSPVLAISRNSPRVGLLL